MTIGLMSLVWFGPHIYGIISINSNNLPNQTIGHSICNAIECRESFHRNRFSVSSFEQSAHILWLSQISTFMLCFCTYSVWHSWIYVAFRRLLVVHTFLPSFVQRSVCSLTMNPDTISVLNVISSCCRRRRQRSRQRSSVHSHTHTQIHK